jgi:hypothetical protein
MIIRLIFFSIEYSDPEQTKGQVFAVMNECTHADVI